MNITSIRHLNMHATGIDPAARSALPMQQIIADARFQMESLLPPVPWEIGSSSRSASDRVPPEAPSGLDVIA